MPASECIEDQFPMRTEVRMNDNQPRGTKANKRRPFYASDKKAVCEMYLTEEGITHEELARRFNVTRSMISRTLKKSEKWLMSKHTDGQKFARRRMLKFWKLERRMSPWLIQCREDNAVLTDKMIMEHAIEIAEDEGMRGGGHIYQFPCSQKWLRNFKARFGIIDGVATRVGYTATDLAREKAFGSFPLDTHFWLQLPDEHGNFPQRSTRRKGVYDDWDWKQDGDFIIYIPPSTTTGSTPSHDASDVPASSFTSPGTDAASLGCSGAVIINEPGVSDALLSSSEPDPSHALRSPSSSISPGTAGFPPEGSLELDMPAPAISSVASVFGMLDAPMMLPFTPGPPDLSFYTSPPLGQSDYSVSSSSSPITPLFLPTTVDSRIPSSTFSPEQGMSSNFLPGDADLPDQWPAMSRVGDTLATNMSYASLNQPMLQGRRMVYPRSPDPQGFEQFNTPEAYLEPYLRSAAM